MKRLRAKMFNRKASLPKYMPDRILETIAVRPGSSIADIGAGGGYYALRFAGLTGPEGRVYAVDTKKGYLEMIKSEASKKDLKNISTLLSHELESVVAAGELDIIFMRNVTHHISGRPEYFKGIRKLLKPDGKVVIIDYKKDRPDRFHKPSSHYVSREVIIDDMRNAGYEPAEEHDFLPVQNFIIFRAGNDD